MNFWEYITNKETYAGKIKYIVGIALLIIFIIAGCVMCHMEDKKDNQPGQETGIDEDEEGLTSEYTGDDTEEWLTDDDITLDDKDSSNKTDNSENKKPSGGLQVIEGNSDEKDSDEEESDEKVDHSTGNNPSVEEAPGDTEWGRLI